MAEAHPVGFQWVMEAKRAGRHGDPRRPALHPHLGGRRPARPDPGRLRHRVPRRPGQPRAQQRARLPRVRRAPTPTRATIIDEDFRDTEDLDGLFSGFDPETGTTTRRPGSTRATEAPAAGQREPDADGRRPGEAPGDARGRASEIARLGRRRRGHGRRDRDETLQHPRCVFQILKRHFARYTPEMVQRGLRHRPRAVRRGRRGADPQQRPGAHHRVLLRRRLDAPQRRRADDPHRLDPADAAGQHRPAGRRHHGAARARQHPGLHRHPDAVQHPARATCRCRTRDRTRTSTSYVADDAGTDGLLGQHARLRREPAEVLLGRRRHRRTTTSASTTCRGSTGDHSTYTTVKAQIDGELQGLLPGRGEPRRRLGQRQDAAARHGQPRLAGRPRPADDRVGDVLEGRPRDRDRRAGHRGHRHRGVLPARRLPRARRPARSPRPSGCCSGATRPSTRPATAAASWGSTTSSAQRIREKLAGLHATRWTGRCWTSPGTTPIDEQRRAERGRGAARDQRHRRRRQGADRRTPS